MDNQVIDNAIETTDIIGAGGSLTLRCRTVIENLLRKQIHGNLIRNKRERCSCNCHHRTKTLDNIDRSTTFK